MTPESTSAAGDSAEGTAAEELAKFGITRIPVDYYHYREFRYTRLEDALAQARRVENNLPPDDRIGAHFDKANMAKGGRGRTGETPGKPVVRAAQPSAGKSPSDKPDKRADQPWCDSKGKSIVEGGYTQ